MLTYNKSLDCQLKQIFDSHQNYASVVWDQTKSSISRVFTIQKKP